MIAAVAAYAASDADKANTRRRKLSALSSARVALLRAGVSLPSLPVVLPPRDQDLEAVATDVGEVARTVQFLAKQPGEVEKRSAAAIALAAAGLQTAEIVGLSIEALQAHRLPVAVLVDGQLVELSPATERAVWRWWSTLGHGPGQAFRVTSRTLQRDIERIAERMAPTLTLEGVRRRAIVTAYQAGGAHAAAARGRTINAAFVKRIVEAAGLPWDPDQPPTGPGRGPPRGSRRS